MGKRVGRYGKKMAREMKRGGGDMMPGKRKRKTTGGAMSREKRIAMAEDALGDQPL